jgi:hypothetical protein
MVNRSSGPVGLPLGYLRHADTSSITPFRGHCGNITTTLPYAGAGALNNTYVIQHGPYLISTTKAGIIMGPTNATVVGRKIAPNREVFGQVDDSIVQPQFVDCEMIVECYKVPFKLNIYRDEGLLQG